MSSVSLLPQSPDTKVLWDRIYKTHPIQAPFFTYNWHDVWFRTLGASAQPFALLASSSVIAPFAKDGDVVIFSGGKEVADYLDLIGPDDKKKDAWRDILSFLTKSGVTKLRLHNVPESSPTLSFFTKLMRNHVSDNLTVPTVSITHEDTTPIISLPSTWSTYVAQLAYKDRHELRRKIRKFHREHPQAQIIPGVDPQKDTDDLLRLMRMDSAKDAFLTPQMTHFFKEIITTFHDTIDLLFLLIDGERCASTLSFFTKDAYLLYNSGFDEVRHSNAGFYLKAMSVRRTIQKGLTSYNFLQGSERYKYDLGGKDFNLYTIDVGLTSTAILSPWAKVI